MLFFAGRKQNFSLFRINGKGFAEENALPSVSLYRSKRIRLCVDRAAVLCFVTGIGGRFIPCSSFLRGFRAAGVLFSV